MQGDPVEICGSRAWSLLRNLIPDNWGLSHRKEPASGAGALGQVLAARRASRRRRAGWRKAFFPSALFPRPPPHRPSDLERGFLEPTIRDAPSPSEGPRCPLVQTIQALHSPSRRARRIQRY